ncbi:hypothetical protein [Streptomyces coeruleorubidus]
MGETENTRLMQRIFAGLAEEDGRPLAESLADEFTWTIIGTTIWSGSHEGKQTVLNELFRPLLATRTAGFARSKTENCKH